MDALVAAIEGTNNSNATIFIVLQIRFDSLLSEYGIYGCASSGASVKLPWSAVAESVGRRTQRKRAGHAQSQGS